MAGTTNVYTVNNLYYILQYDNKIPQTTHTNKAQHIHTSNTNAHTCARTYLHAHIFIYETPHTSIHILKYIEYENNSHGTEEETSEMSLLYIHVYIYL